MSYAYDNDEFSRYYDKFVSEHVPNDVYWKDSVKDIYVEIIQRTIIDNRDAIIFELGCGTGENLIYFDNYFQNKHIRLIGIDHSQAMLDRAKEKSINKSNNRIELFQRDITSFSDCLESKLIDCILLPAGTFHHLVTDNERQGLINNIQRTLRPITGLFAIYLFPDSLIRIETPEVSDNEDKLKLISTENIQKNNDEWLCKQTFEFDAPPKIQLSWQLRTCSVTKLINLFISNNFQAVFVCLNGKELTSYNEDILPSLCNISTPAIIVFRTEQITN